MEQSDKSDRTVAKITAFLGEYGWGRVVGTGERCFIHFIDLPHRTAVRPGDLVDGFLRPSQPGKASRLKRIRVLQRSPEPVQPEPRSEFEALLPAYLHGGEMAFKVGGRGDKKRGP